MKCVVLDERLRDLERMAFDFVLNFGRDNDLVISEARLLPERRSDGQGVEGTPQTQSAT